MHRLAWRPLRALKSKVTLYENRLPRGEGPLDVLIRTKVTASQIFDKNATSKSSKALQ